MSDTKQTEESDDGYDSDLFENPEKAAEFKCPICTCICKCPIETEPCGHLYCKGCLQNHLSEQTNDANATPKCPTCRTPIQETSKSKFVERQVFKLRVKCSNFANGCEWKGELKYFKPHLRKDCEWEQIQCKYCNDQSYFRGKASEHLNECPKYPIECDLCNSKIERKDYETHSQKECPNLLLFCPNECGTQIKQSLLSNHILTQCEHRIINCLYHCYGCDIKPKYKDLKLHISQHQIVHLELKIIYLERLAQSKELLSVSNTTGLIPEISGIYQREQIPYLARPVWRHKMNKSFLVRYDSVINGWVLDKNGFERDIVALRRGAYPFPNAMEKDASHILQLEQMFKSEETKEEMKSEELKDNNENSESVWHILIQNGRIKVEGYTEREFDLEWEMKSLSAQMRDMRRHNTAEQQKSGLSSPAPQKRVYVSNVIENNDIKIKEIIRNNYVIGCICGKGMVKLDTNAYNSNNKALNAICNVCENNIMPGLEYYHCPSKRCTKHIDGYDLCVSCGQARQQTQNIKQPSCDCGHKLSAMMSDNTYPNATRVSCNVCASVVSGAVWHCAKGYVKAHERGFDLCIGCGKTYVAKKAGLMGWWSRQ